MSSYDGPSFSSDVPAIEKLHGSLTHLPVQIHFGHRTDVRWLHCQSVIHIFNIAYPETILNLHLFFASYESIERVLYSPNITNR